MKKLIVFALIIAVALGMYLYLKNTSSQRVRKIEGTFAFVKYERGIYL